MMSSFNFWGQINTAAQLERNGMVKGRVWLTQIKATNWFLHSAPWALCMHPSPHWIICCQLTFKQKCNSKAIHYSFQGGVSKKKKVMSSCEGIIDLSNKSANPSCSNEAVSAKSGSDLALICSEGGFESGPPWPNLIAAVKSVIALMWLYMGNWSFYESFPCVIRFGNVIA